MPPQWTKWLKRLYPKTLLSLPSLVVYKNRARLRRSREASLTLIAVVYPKLWISACTGMTVGWGVGFKINP
jgi:hypothetical protein